MSRRRKPDADPVTAFLRDASLASEAHDDADPAHDANPAHDAGPAHDADPAEAANPAEDADPAHEAAIDDFHTLRAVDAIIHALCESVGVPFNLDMAMRHLGTLAAKRLLHPPPAPPPDPLQPVQELLRHDEDRSKAMLEGTARLVLQFGVDPADIDSRLHVLVLQRARLEAQAAADLLALVGRPESK